LEEEYTLTAIEDRVLRRIFRPKRDERTGRGIKLHDQEFRNLYLIN
jgi:hypothetical protein